MPDYGAVATDPSSTWSVMQMTTGETMQVKVTSGPGFAGAPRQVNTVPASGAAQTLPDPTAQPLSAITLTANCTLTFPAVVAGKVLEVALKQDATGSRTVTWPGTVKWPGGTVPTLTTTAAKTDVFNFVCVDGVSWLGYTIGLNF